MSSERRTPEIFSLYHPDAEELDPKEAIEDYLDEGKITLYFQLDEFFVEIKDQRIAQDGRYSIITSSSFPLHGIEAEEFFELLEQYEVVQSMGASNEGIAGKVWKVDRQKYYESVAHLKLFDVDSNLKGQENEKALWYWILRAFYESNDHILELQGTHRKVSHNYLANISKNWLNRVYDWKISPKAGRETLHHVVKKLVEEGYLTRKSTDISDWLYLSEKGYKFIGVAIPEDFTFEEETN